MKNLLTVVFILMLTVCVARADDRPIDYKKLPEAAKSFVTANYPDEKVLYAVVDDDLIRPDYTVMLANGVKMQFEHSGPLEKIEASAGIPSDLVPYQIRDYVKIHYPDAIFTGYEVGRKTYEVELSNRLEIKFNKNFHAIEIDD